MEEDEAYQFDATVLGLLRPKLLIVSTPNYEYNAILHKSARYHPKDKSMSPRSKFRNHDHKFEWTRAQFKQWASKLAERHSYSVEFSGVGWFKKDPGRSLFLNGDLSLRLMSLKRSQKDRCSLIKSNGNGIKTHLWQKVLQDMSLEFDGLQTEFMDLEAHLTEREVKPLVRRKLVSRKREVKHEIKKLQKLMSSISRLRSSLIREAPGIQGVVLILGGSPLRTQKAYELLFTHSDNGLSFEGDFSKSKARLSEH